MRRSLIFVFFAILFLRLNPVSAQHLFGNEWITDYNTTYYKIKIVKDGLYKIDYSALQSIGLNNALGNQLVVYCRGEEVPIYVSTTGAISSNDYLMFYAKHNDGWFDSLLFDNPSKDHFNPMYSMFSDTAAYYLAAIPGVHKRVSLINYNSSTQTPESYCWYESIYEDHSSYSGGLNVPFTLGSKVFPSTFDAGEGYFGLYFNSSYAYSLSTPDLYTSNNSLNASSTIYTASTRVIPNNLGADINGAYTFPQGQLSFNTIQVNKFSSNSIPVANLTSGSNVFNFTINPGGAYNGVSIITLRYPRGYSFTGINNIHFDVPLNASPFANKHLVSASFDNMSADVLLWDFDANLFIKQAYTNGMQGFDFELPSSTLTNRHLFVCAAPQVNSITNFKPIRFIDFSQSSNQGNFIIITHKGLRTLYQGKDMVREYAAYRNDIAGGGYDTSIVDIEQLYEQFAHGITKHSLAIRNFSNFIETYSNKPRPYYILLMGKGQLYSSTRRNVNRYKLNSIPTFGNPGADELLTAWQHDKFSHLAISRLSVYTPREIKVYLDKLQWYERQQRESAGTGEQSVLNKDWMKQVIHLSGGSDIYQQQLFDGYLNTMYANPLAEPMKVIIEDTTFGANVHVFKKTSSAPVQMSSSAKLDSLINNGVSIINFFGHSAFSTLEFAIDNPGSYKNYGRFPLMISNGCFTGNLFEDPANDPNKQRGLSERFIVPDTNSNPSIGAIGYLSTSDLGISTGLNYFSNTLYQNISRRNYGNTIGECIRLTRDSLLRNQNINSQDIIIAAEQMLLNGDPAIRINPHPEADYVIDSTLMRLNPRNISFEQGGQFHLLFDVRNIGRYKKDSLDILVLRYFPKPDMSPGSVPSLIQQLRIATPSYNQSFDIAINTEPDRALGLNKLTVIIDPQNKLSEIDDNNNEASITFSVSSLDILPIFPYPYAIVGDTTNFYLKASTVEANAPTRYYRIESDTTALFNSSLRQTNYIRQVGGVVQWKGGIKKWMDSTVYYWRVAVDTLYGNHQLNWHTTSFTYIKGSSTGWDQSHYFEFKNDDFLTESIEADRIFHYANNVRTMKVRDFGNGSSDQVSAYLDYQKMNNGGSCIPYGVYGGPSPAYGGFNIAVLDSLTGTPLISNYPNIQQGDYNCSGNQNLNVFQYLTNGYLTASTWGSFSPNNTASSVTQQQSYLSNFLNNYVPDGAYVLLYSINTFNPAGFDPSLRNTLHTVLGTAVLDTMTASRTYVYFGRKGGHGYPVHEVQAGLPGGLVDTSFQFYGNWFQGSVTSTIIGPAQSWSSLHWRYTPYETPSTDVDLLEVIGIDTAGLETVVYTNSTASTADINLNFISAVQYPQLKLRLTSKDTIHRTPAQLQYWRVNYSPLPDVALDKNGGQYVHKDTLQRGDPFVMKWLVRNISPVAFDTLRVKYTLIKANNQQDVFYQVYRKMPSADTVWAYLKLNSMNLVALNTLLIELNPSNYYHKPEQHHFNNLAKLSFLVTRDNVNPILDVTFDHQRILDGDIVSPHPEIDVRLNDENLFLILDSINVLTAWLKSPNSTTYVQQTSANSGLVFYPAQRGSKSNTARLKLNPSLNQDGEYKLKVQGLDRSGNLAGDLSYEIGFNVITNSSITQVMNYPNPFTTSTRFVFTLTGSVLPDYFKIQIFSVSGKMVRELTLNELGLDLHIGRNISTYAWDGTDQYGDPLGNGVYFYRVVTKLDGQNMDILSSGADAYFKSGFGKMYLMR
ncbi:MAG: C25 family cysteine peptidase [Chitinophagales bacterium]|nr:C25 family cysteine peptidase [Chitinophagales bacterium]